MMKVKTQQDYDNLEIVDPYIKSVNILDGWATGWVLTKQDKVSKDTCYEVWITDGVCHEESYGATSLDNITGVVNWLTEIGKAIDGGRVSELQKQRPEFILYTTVNGYCGEHGELLHQENEQPTIHGLVSDEWVLESQGK